jgi:drug/metabolite transporter (DMT)-like permease
VRAVGIGVAVLAIVLASRPSASGGSWEGIRFAVAAGIGFGLFITFISRVTPGHVFAPLAVARVADIGLLVAIVLVGRQPWRIPRPALPLVLLAGVLDMGGNAFFMLAAQAGRLDVAAVLSSLYPVTTVILAFVILRERLAFGQTAGIALALLAIVLIAAG